MPEEKLKGIGGWLLFFIITLILSTLILIYDILTNLSSTNIITLILLFIEATIVVIFIISLVYLFKEDKKGVEILKWALWLPMGNVILAAVLLLFILQIVDSEVNTTLITELIRGVIYAIIWTTYLRKSVRVRNTYYKI